MPANDLIFNEWRVANREAHVKEQALAKACLKALEGNTEWPPLEEREAAQKLRHTADDLFQVAMSQIDDKARQNKRC